MKYLGIDWGTKRIGIAISDTEGRVAFPLTTISSNKESVATVYSIAQREEVKEFVIGESRNFAGEPNAIMAGIEKFKHELEEISGLPVSFEPEFMTSAAAGREGETSNEKIDASAAALILQSYIDKNRR